MDEVLDYVRDLLDPLGVTDSEVTEDGDKDDAVVLVRPHSDLAARAIIGQEGRTYKALDRLVRVVGRTMTGHPVRLVVDPSQAR